MKENSSRKKSDRIKRKRNKTQQRKKTTVESSQTSYRKKRKKQRQKLTPKQKKQLKCRRKWCMIKRHLVEVCLAVAISAVILLLVFGSFYGETVVPDYSMNPTMNEGNRLIYRKKSDIQRFDILAINDSENNKFISRVIGLPGEQLQYLDDQLLIDERPIVERYIVDMVVESHKNDLLYTENFDSNDLIEGGEIPAGYYLVLGDNRSLAKDSRSMGLIAAEDIQGVVTYRWFPLHSMEFY